MMHLEKEKVKKDLLNMRVDLGRVIETVFYTKRNEFKLSMSCTGLKIETAEQKTDFKRNSKNSKKLMPLSGDE